MKKFLKGSAIAMLIFIFLLGFFVLIVYFSAPKRFNILIIGTDQRGEERSRSDVLMVFSIPKSKKEQTTLLTIPRDTRVEIPGYGEDKITHAYVYGERKEGEILGNVDLTKETVENFLDVEINAVFEFNFTSFQEIVDRVDGITVNGVKMNGEKALEVVRNRYRDGGDFARTEDQREVFQGVIRKSLSKENATKVLAYLKTSKNARFDYEKNKAIHFGLGFIINRWTAFLGFGNGLGFFKEIKEEVVPGKGGSYYSKNFGQNLYFWVPDEKELKELKKRGLE